MQPLRTACPAHKPCPASTLRIGLPRSAPHPIPRPRVNHTPNTVLYLSFALFSLYFSYLPRFPLFSSLFLSSPPSLRSPLHTPRRPPDASRLALQPRLCTSAQCQKRDEKHPREPSLVLCHGCLTLPLLCPRLTLALCLSLGNVFLANLTVTVALVMRCNCHGT